MSKNEPRQQTTIIIVIKIIKLLMAHNPVCFVFYHIFQMINENNSP